MLICHGSHGELIQASPSLIRCFWWRFLPCRRLNKEPWSDSSFMKQQAFYFLQQGVGNDKRTDFSMKFSLQVTSQWLGGDRCCSRSVSTCPGLDLLPCVSGSEHSLSPHWRRKRTACRNCQPGELFPIPAGQARELCAPRVSGSPQPINGTLHQAGNPRPPTLHVCKDGVRPGYDREKDSSWY